MTTPDLQPAIDALRNTPGDFSAAINILEGFPEAQQAIERAMEHFADLKSILTSNVQPA